jgi:hypothetical protein
MTLNNNQLWLKLCKIEDQARAMAAEQTNIHRYVTQSGSDAKCHLNRILGKKENAKFKTYSLKERERAITEVEKPDFLSTLVEKYVKEATTPESQMAHLRALAIAKGEPVQYPKELLDQIKSTLSLKIENLWKQLEDLGIVVHELADEGQGVVGFKISTPISTYLSFAKPHEILNIAKQDIELSKNSKCPFCKTPFNIAERNSGGIGFCNKCDAMYLSIPGNLRLERELNKSNMFDTALKILLTWDDSYEYDRAMGLSWIKRPSEDSVPDVKIAQFRNDVEQIIGPDTSNPQLTIEVPRLQDIDDNEHFITASCDVCAYRSIVHDNSNYIIGLEDSGNFHEEGICTFPSIGKDIFEEGFLELKPEQMRGYRDNDEGIIWNKFMKILLEQLYFIRGLESTACFPEHKNEFHGPICPRFIFNHDAFDLEKQGGQLKLSGKEKAVFGLK